MKGNVTPLDDLAVKTNQTIQVVKNMIKDGATTKRASKGQKNKKKQKDLQVKTKDLIH